MCVRRKCVCVCVYVWSELYNKLRIFDNYNKLVCSGTSSAHTQRHTKTHTVCVFRAINWEVFEMRCCSPFVSPYKALNATNTQREKVCARTHTHTHTVVFPQDLHIQLLWPWQEHKMLLLSLFFKLPVPLPQSSSLCFFFFDCFQLHLFLCFLSVSVYFLPFFIFFLINNINVCWTNKQAVDKVFLVGD